MRVTRSWLLCLWCAFLACGCGDDDAPKKREADAGEMQLPDKTAGKACNGDEDCPNGECMRDLKVGSMTGARKAPGGYCTASCNRDSQCGERGECSVAAGEDRGLCLGMCKSQDDCREGYVCVGVLAGGLFNGGGSCQPMQQPDELGDRVAGRECASDGDCLGGSCASASPLGSAYPSNYCTGRCWEDSQCGDGGVCWTQAGTAEAGWCLERCGTASDCARRGYGCVQVKSGLNACFPAPDGLPDGTTGKACASDADCGGSKDACASVLPYKTFSAYEDIEAPGGYCTSKCSLDSECGEGGVCISRGPQGGMCLQTCSEKSDCREGYGCELHGRAASFDGKVCVPRPDEA